jgi:hypothetical protein
VFEVIITGGIIATAAVAATRRPMTTAAAPAARPVGGDLPCPWCHADTAENDDRCPGCGQVFG